MGSIIEIQSFARNNGPGIRTIVFLSGCPLRCEWCCNPESFNENKVLAYRFDKCTQCLECVNSCPSNTLQNIDGQLYVDHSSCIGCGKCLKVCNTDALKLFGEAMTVEKVMKRVLQDKPYFDKYGGGITLSGGEPLMQQHFALNLLKQAKNNELHTAVETSGYVQQSFLMEIWSYVDIFLFDYKLSDDELHLKFTGKSNQIILSNLSYLNQQGASIILRCPIIPGINDEDNHFQRIAELSNQFNGIQSVEVLPYHKLGAYKYPEIGLPIPDIESSDASDEQVGIWLKKLSDFGCKNLIRK